MDIARSTQEENSNARMNWWQVGDAMMEAGRAFGEETSLGSLYMVVGEAQKEITKSWCAANPFLFKHSFALSEQGAMLRIALPQSCLSVIR
jgi:hypothetical protein